MYIYRRPGERGREEVRYIKDNCEESYRKEPG